MPYSLPKLAFPLDALEPTIDAKTVEIHYGKHHAAYVDKLNKALENKPDLAAKPIEELISKISKLPDDVRTAVANNGGQHYNHSLYWATIAPMSGGEPTSELLAGIKKDFGSFEAFKEKLSSAAVNQFGGGWAWAYVNNGKILVGSTSNQQCPLMDTCEIKGIPILTIDVWEHAYYLKYQNRRPEYVAAFWNVINWKAVADLYSRAKK
jgi:Fe-Mn family superoxide dismutase